MRKLMILLVAATMLGAAVPAYAQVNPNTGLPGPCTTETGQAGQSTEVIWIQSDGEGPAPDHIGAACMRAVNREAAK